MTDKTKEKTILRIGIHALSSPLWSGNGQDLFMFLHALRGLLRSSLAVCMITCPSYLFHTSWSKKLEHLVDGVVQFQSFTGNGGKVPETFQEYDGLFMVKKLPHLNSLVAPHPESLKYIFRLGRRKLHLDIPHLGPEESRTADTKSVTSAVLTCAPGPPRSSTTDW